MTTIAPNDANIVYSPYTWDVTSGRAKTICSGAYLRVMFSGTPSTLSATFDVSTMPAGTLASKVALRVDGGLWQESTVAASMPLTLATDNTWGTHTVEMVMVSSTETVDRWTSQLTAVKFTGLVADVTVTTRASRARNLYGAVFGDSITEGVRTKSMTATGDPNRNDSRLAYSLPLADLLGAEVGVVGFGAVGISKTGSGNVPRFCLSAPYLWDGQARSLSTPTAPNFIVNHIGTNDSTSADPDVTADTTALLNWQIANTPSSTAILVLPGWLQRKASAIQAGIAACTAPPRITYVDTTGWWSTADASDATHPYGYINQTQLAPRLAASIKAALTTSSGSKTYRRDGSGNWIQV